MGLRIIEMVHSLPSEWVRGRPPTLLAGSLRSIESWAADDWAMFRVADAKET